MRKIFVVILVLSMFCLNLFSGVNENLIFACNGFSDNPTKVKELIEKGANPEFLDKLTKKTSLMLAAGKGFVKIITELSNNSVDIDKQDEKGNTALIYACIAGKPEAVKSLISLKADVDLLNKDGETPLISLVKKSMATEKIKIDIISQLVAAGCDVNLKDKNDENAFLVESGKAIPNDKIVEKLIEVKSDLNLICKRTGDTALIMYIKVPFKIEMTKKLVKAGADVNMRGKNGITPLNCVIDSAYGDQRYIIPTLKVLIEDGKADINAMDDFGNALHYAAHETFINPTPRNEIGAYLISKGIDINARNNIYGTTPLMDLFRKSELDSYDFSLFKILLENKANIRLFDNNGNLVFNYAKNFEDDIYNLFEQIVKVYNPDYVSYKESILKRDDVGYAKENGKIKFTFKPENYRNIPDGIKSVKAVFFTTRKSPEYSEEGIKMPIVDIAYSFTSYKNKFGSDAPNVSSYKDLSVDLVDMGDGVWQTEINEENIPKGAFFKYAVNDKFYMDIKWIMNDDDCVKLSGMTESKFNNPAMMLNPEAMIYYNLNKNKIDQYLLAYKDQEATGLNFFKIK